MNINSNGKSQFTIQPAKPFASFVHGVNWAFAALLLLSAFDGKSAVILTTLYSFSGSGDGGDPGASLVQGSDGDFYGTTQNFGSKQRGTVFKITAGGNLTTLSSFPHSGDGANPSCALVQGSDGLFYGTSDAGGTLGGGTLFNVSSNGNLNTIYSFTGNDGNAPEAGLTKGSNGEFYGTTYYGGAPGDGNVFKFTPMGTPSNLYSFKGGADGSSPACALALGDDSSLYGTTSYGGIHSRGTVFKITTNGMFTSLYSFSGADGASPVAGLVQGSDGNFYGTTSLGGVFSNGVVFRISKNGMFTNLYSFTGGSDGSGPDSPLIQGSDGYYYGTTQGGGASKAGSVFKISDSGVFSSLFSFTGGHDGGFPVGGLVQATNGSFYGTTDNGGDNQAGAIFRMTVLPDFQTGTLTSDTLNLTWSAELGATYQLQYTSDLNSINWLDLASPVTASGISVTVTDSITNGSQRFYRLAVVL